MRRSSRRKTHRATSSLGSGCCQWRSGLERGLLAPAFCNTATRRGEQRVPDTPSRIRRIRTDRWITYGRAEAALCAMEDLLTFPKRTRMPNLLLCGPTNNGKTMIVEKLRRAHPPIAASATPDGAANVPVLKVQMPAGPDEPRFFGAILDELGFPHMLSDRVAKRRDAAVRTL